MICYILLCGYPPFYGEKDKDILAMVKKGAVKFDPADWSDVSSDAIDFIKLMLTYDPKTRQVRLEVGSSQVRHTSILMSVLYRFSIGKPTRALVGGPSEKAYEGFL